MFYLFYIISYLKNFKSIILYYYYILINILKSRKKPLKILINIYYIILKRYFK